MKNKHIEAVVFDVSNLNNVEKEISIEEIRSKNRMDRLDLSLNPLKITICKLSEEEWELIILNHHILYDGWSNGILIKEFLEVYNCLYENNEPVPKRKTKYKEYIRWSQGIDKTKEKEYWRHQLEGLETG